MRVRRHWRFGYGTRLRGLLLALARLCAVSLAVSRAAAAEGDLQPLKPADTSSPRATLQSFIENMNSMYSLLKEQGPSADASQTATFKMRAVRCLDLGKIDPSAVEGLGEQRAVLLTEILDRIKLPPPEEIPDADDFKEKENPRWRIPDTEITIVRVAEGPRQGEFLLSDDTVSRIPEFYDRVKYLPYRPGTVLEGAYEKLFTLAPPAPSKDNPLKPADTASPQATLRTFLDNMNAVYRSFKAHGMSREALAERRDSVSRVTRCLNLGTIPPSVVDEVGRETAVMLMEIFDRIDIPVIEQVPDAKKAEELKLASWTIPNTEITIARVEDGPRKGEFLFTPETVSRAQRYYERVVHLPYRDGTVLKNAYQVYLQAPGPMIPISWVLAMPSRLKSIVFGQPLWKWVALALVLMLFVTVFVLAFRLGGRGRQDDSPAPLRKRIVIPVVGICLALFAERAIHQIRVMDDVMIFTSSLMTLIIAVSVLWLVVLVINAIAEAIVASPRINPRSIDAQVVRIAFRLLSLGAIVLIVLQTAHVMGIPLTPVLAGLGVGGIAIALAAQNSIENLIGGFNLFTDRPIRVGDLCRFGQRIGTVEEIGLRSVRVRSLDDTVVAIPNASFSKMELENFSKRRRIWYHPRIQLAKDATPDQIRCVLVEVRKILYSHPKVDPDPARIRFAEFGSYSLDLDVFAYVAVSDYGEYLGIAEDLNLRIMEIVSRAGTSLAVPSQRTFLERVAGPNDDRAEQAEQQVQQWRENNQLYLPSFPEDVVNELKATLDYPPKGSPKG